jgi:lambda repressor-like predicted transcriptional regulator
LNDSEHTETPAEKAEEIMPKYKARTDSTQAAIVAALRQTGATVVDLSRCGSGIPDLLVGRVMPCPFCQAYQPRAILLEVKTAHGKLNKLQEEFHASWRGPIYTVKTIEDALAALDIDPRMGAVLAALGEGEK